MKIQIRDIYDLMNKRDDRVTFEGIQIVGPDGRTLFEIYLNEDYSIEIGGGEHARVGNVLLDDTFNFTPKSGNRMIVRKPVLRELGK